MQKETYLKTSSEGLLVRLVSTLVKHTEKINDLEHKLGKQQEKMERQQEKHDEDLKKVVLQLGRKHSEDLRNLALDVEKLKHEHINDINILKGIIIIENEIPHYCLFGHFSNMSFKIIMKGSSAVSSHRVHKMVIVLYYRFFIH